MATRMSQPKGIEGLQGREPVGAVLTIGTKGENGAPTHRDRFYFKEPLMDASGRKPPALGFKKWNEGHPRMRQVVPAVLVHAKQQDCFEYNLKAQVLPRHPQHPRRVPTCVGDGVSAVRYVDGEFQKIHCPNDACEFRQGKKKACSAWMRLLFRPAWTAQWEEKFGVQFRTPLVKFASYSWNTVRNAVGFFEYVENQARSLGLPSWTFYGLPLTLTLHEKTNPELGTRFPVVSFAPTGDVQRFLIEQHQRMRELRGPQPVAGLLDSDQQDADEVADDHAEITPGLAPPRDQGDVVDGEPEESAETEEAEASSDPTACQGCGERLAEGNGRGPFCPECGWRPGDEVPPQAGLFGSEES